MKSKEINDGLKVEIDKVTFLKHPIHIIDTNEINSSFRLSFHELEQIYLFAKKNK